MLYARDGTVKRIELINKIKGYLNCNLVILSAPLGYGKSTAVKQFLESEGSNYVWIRTKEGDKDAVWNSFISSFDSGLYKKFKKIGFPDSDKKLTDVTKILIENIKKNTILVYDKLACKDDNWLCKLIADIVNASQNKIKTIVTTEKPINSCFLNMAIKGTCKIIDSPYFAFSCQEINSYMLKSDIEFSDSEVKFIREFTGGWIFIISLIKEDYKMSKNIRSFPRTEQYIKRILFDRQEGILRDIVLRLIPIGEFSFEQALYLLGYNSYSSNNLERILQEGKFFFRATETGLYSMYPIIKKAIYGEFIVSMIDEKSLFKKNGVWFELNKDYIKSLENYNLAQSTSDILRIFSLIEEFPDDVHTVETLADSFEIIKKYCYEKFDFYMKFIYSYAKVMGRHEALEKLSDAEAHYLSFLGEKGFSKELAMIYYLRSFLEFNDTKNMLYWLKESCKYLKSEDSVNSIVCNRDLFGNFSPVTTFYRISGTLKPTIEILSEFMWLKANITGDSDTAIKLLIDADYSLTVWEYENAVTFANKAIVAAKLSEQYDIQLSAYLVLLRVYIFTKAREECEAIVEKIIQIVDKNKVDEVAPHLILGYYNAMMNNVQKIDSWIRNGDLDECAVWNELKPVSYIVIGLSMLAEQKYEKLEVLALTMLNPGTKKQKYQIIQIYAYIFYAIAKDKENQSKYARESLWKAIDLSSIDGITVPFIELARYIIHYLEDIAEQNLFVKTILGNCKASANIMNLKNQSIESYNLTLREREISTLILRNMKQNEIANNLFISLSTVKKHVRSIYEKLGVETKNEAIEKLRNIGL